MGLGQYNSLGEYCGPHTASSVFLILILQVIVEHHVRPMTALLGSNIVTQNLTNLCVFTQTMIRCVFDSCKS